jgi:hypothetical protein
MTKEHSQKMNIHLITNIPEHAPREEDPHYHMFNEVKGRIKRAGLWKCIIDDDLCAGTPELHHSHIEYSQIENTDPNKVAQAFGLHFEDDEDFQEWIESPGNLEVLCTAHHRTHFGIHVIPAPLWNSLRYRKVGSKPAAEVLTNNDIINTNKEKQGEINGNSTSNSSS